MISIYTGLVVLTGIFKGSNSGRRDIVARGELLMRHAAAPDHAAAAKVQGFAVAQDATQTQTAFKFLTSVPT